MNDARANLAAGKQVTKAVSLLEPLSSGGMGAVWLADHLGLKTRVVVKFMLGGLDSSDSARTRFSREAAAAAQVKSPHVVQMLDHGVSDDGVPFIVMEHLEGHDLGDEIEEHGALDPAKVILIVTQVAKALSKVHAAGLLHRDIKPDNIFLCEGEEELFVKLLDFGIAKSSRVDQGDGSLDGETKTGQTVGTPFYMSPEQVTASKKIDHRSDLWALGIVAYEALTAQRPYDGPSFGALAVKIATAAPPKPSEANAALPASVDAWFEKACARDPANRFSSAKEMSEALRAAFEGVVSLPGISSDSGQRGLSSSGARSGSDSGPRDAESLALAATAEDGASDRRRSRRSRNLMIAMAATLTALVAVALIVSIRPPHPEAIAAPPPPSSLVAPTRSTEPPALPPPPASATAVPGMPDAAAVRAPSIAPGPTRSSVRPPPPAQPTSLPGVRPVEPIAPKPPTKPASSEPDLY